MKETLDDLVQSIGQGLPTEVQASALYAGLDDLPPENEALRRKILVILSEYHVFNDRIPEARACIAQGMVLSSGEGATGARFRLEFALGICAYTSDDLVGAITIMSSVRQRANAANRPSVELRACVGLCMFIVLLGDPTSALRILDDAQNLREHGSARLLISLDRTRILALLQLGDLDQADALVRDVDMRDASPREQTLYRVVRAEILVRTGRPHQAGRLASAIHGDGPGMAGERAQLHLIQAKAAYQMGRYSSTLEHVDAVTQDGVTGPVRPIAAEAFALKARVLHIRGDHEGMWTALDRSHETLRAVTVDTVGQAIHAVVAPALAEVEHVRTVELHNSHVQLSRTVAGLYEANNRLQEEAAEHLRTKEELRRSHVELRDSHRDLVRAAHFAGMAEVATGVLHDLGNTLNSVVTSVTLARRSIRKLSQSAVSRVAKRLQDEATDPDAVAGYLKRLATGRQASLDGLDIELERSDRALQHASRIISTQQRNAARPRGLERMAVLDLVEDAVELVLDMVPGVDVIVQVPKDEEIITAPIRVVRILMNLLKNARDAVEGDTGATISIVLSISDENQIALDVTDSGPGIGPEMADAVFRHGFTTKVEGNGFGLHASATAAVEIGGTLALMPPAVGHGATFRLTLLRQASGTRLDILETQGACTVSDVVEGVQSIANKP